MARLSWTQPICDDCFDELFPKNANPTRIKPEFQELEKCCWCGKLGIKNGLYVRINPQFAPYASLVK